MKKWLFTAYFILLSAGAWCTPTLLIVQLIDPTGDEPEKKNLTVDYMLADAFDELGQVEPIVWSEHNPKIQKFIADGVIDSLGEPTDDRIRIIARSLRVDYTMVVAVTKENGDAMPLARVYRGSGGRPVWSYGFGKGQERKPMIMTDGEEDEAQSRQVKAAIGDFKEEGRALTVSINGIPDWQSTGLTIARTFARLLKESAFKQYPVRPNVTSPIPANDLRIKPDRDRIVAPPGLLADQMVTELRQSGELANAIVVLRDAIDQRPSEISLRIQLADILSELKLYSEAAQIWEGVAKKVTNQADAWLKASINWAKASEPIKAQNAVQNALARGAVSHVALTVLGESLVLKGDYLHAIDTFNKSMEIGPTPQALVGRATAYALLGDAINCKRDLTALMDAKPEDTELAYISAIEMTELRLDTILPELIHKTEQIRYNELEPEGLAHIQNLAKSNSALVVLMKLIPVPSRFERSHKARLLAHNLISNSCQEMLKFARTNDPEVGKQAENGIKEVLTLLPGIKETFQKERRN